MPTLKQVADIIRAAEAVVGRMSNAVRCALLDEHFPDCPARDLAYMVHGLSL